jgi:hypothetical protein
MIQASSLECPERNPLANGIEGDLFNSLSFRVDVRRELYKHFSNGHNEKDWDCGRAVGPAYSEACLSDGLASCSQACQRPPN